MRPFLSILTLVLLAAPATAGADLHLGVQESSEACQGTRERYAGSGGNETRAYRYNGSHRDETCTWRDDALVATLDVEGERVAQAHVGERREGDVYASSHDYHESWSSGETSNSSYRYHHEQTAWDEGAEARVAGHDAQVRYGACRGGVHAHESHYDNSTSWRDSRGNGTWSDCTRGAYAEALGQRVAHDVYPCENSQYEYRRDDGPGGSRASNESFTRRDCRIAVEQTVIVNGTGTEHDGDGYIVRGGYYESDYQRCYTDEDAPDDSSCWGWRGQGPGVQVIQLRDGWYRWLVFQGVPLPWNPVLP